MVQPMTAFEQEFDLMRAQIAEMGGLAEKQLADAMEAIQRRDARLTDEVVLRDRRIDKLETDIDALVIRIFSVRRPMAQDFREVIATLKTASTLERVGDLSKNIARRAGALSELPPSRRVGPILRMGDLVRSQLANALTAFAKHDVALARRVWESDEEIDELYNSLFRELLTYMMEDNRTIGLCTQLMFAAKNLERIGDHATFVAEMAHYVIEGRPPREDRPKGAPDGLIVRPEEDDG